MWSAERLSLEKVGESKCLRHGLYARVKDVKRTRLRLMTDRISSMWVHTTFGDYMVSPRSP
jgi:hypothetical protein